jgi:hypothetical protein
MITFKAEIIFFESAATLIRFPIIKNIRLSLWLKGSMNSLPSEFRLEESVGMLKKHIVTIDISNWNGVEKKFTRNAEFNIGSFNSPLGEGRILEIINH